MLIWMSEVLVRPVNWGLLLRGAVIHSPFPEEEPQTVLYNLWPNYHDRNFTFPKAFEKCTEPFTGQISSIDWFLGFGDLEMSCNGFDFKFQINQRCILFYPGYTGVCKTWILNSVGTPQRWWCHAISDLSVNSEAGEGYWWTASL